MSVERKIKERTRRRVLRVRSKFGDQYPRVSVFQSLQHMYAQIIDDKNQTTLISCSSLQVPQAKGDKKAVAFTVGSELAKKAAEKGIRRVVFDRGERRYHGRVKALADGLREGGLDF